MTGNDVDVVARSGSSERATRHEDRRIRALRPPKPPVDPSVAHGAKVEVERRPDGSIENVLTVFLAGAECPYTCSFCDLWRTTIEGPTPVGALVTQLETALRAVPMPLPDRIKLYNASNFFDRRAVPETDRPSIARLVADFSGVTVESHVNTIGAPTIAFAEQIAGRLEVAMGLETVHPVAMAHLNKRLDLDRFDRAVDFLVRHDVDVRVFVLLGAPHVPATESVDWTVRAVEHAVRTGAAVVSIIPVRGGNGEMERLAALDLVFPPTLVQLEAALDRSLDIAGSTVVTADLWDVALLGACDTCRAARVARMERRNRTGIGEPPIACAACQ